MFLLHVVPPVGEPFDQPLEQESLIIGRSRDAGLVIPDRFLSRRHARLFVQGDELLIEDLGSRNGTLVNGQTIRRPTALQAGDTIKVSGSTIAVRRAGEPEGERDVSTTSPITVFRRASDLIEQQERPATAVESQDALRRYTARLQLLNEVHRALGRSVAIEELLDLILERVFEQLRPEEGVILLKQPNGEFRRARSRTPSRQGSDYLYSQTLVHEVAGKGLSALVTDALTDTRFSKAESILSSGVRSLVAAPLLSDEGSLGMIVLGSRVHVRQFSEEDMELLTSLASVAGLRIANLTLAEEAAERRRLQRELDLARRIQVALLPDQLPEVPGWELHAGNIPSRGVSGDYYEAVERLAGRELVLMVADVSGKGIAASLLTAALEALSAGPIEEGLPPDKICAKLSRLLYRRTPPERYATAFLAVLDAAGGRLVYTNAGHNPALLLRRSGEVEQLGPTGLPIGLMPVTDYRASDLTIEDGDTLLIYTDGIVEAARRDEEEYGLERLVAIGVRHRERPLDEMVQEIENDLNGFVEGAPFTDDRTVMLLRRAVSPAG